MDSTVITDKGLELKCEKCEKKVPNFNETQLKLFGAVLVLLISLWAKLSIKIPKKHNTLESDVFLKQWLVDVITVPSGPSGTRSEVVTRIQNFFPGHLAEEVYGIMEEAWHNSNVTDLNLESEHIKDSINLNTTWLFTTNNFNSKVRSNVRIRSRHEEMVRKLKSSSFAYSKFELLNETARNLVVSMLSHASARKALEKLPQLQGERIVGLADLFFTLYAKNNFLSLHNDAASGSIALVISLTKNWKREYGGILRFLCRNDQSFCRELVPEFNTAYVFRSRPVSLYHEVSGVTIPDNELTRRYAVTTWFTTDKDMANPLYAEHTFLHDQIWF